MPLFLQWGSRFVATYIGIRIQVYALVFWELGIQANMWLQTRRRLSCIVLPPRQHEKRLEVACTRCLVLQMGKGLKAKEEMKLIPLRIPKRSPDLNVLDYAIWSEVERRMRNQEQHFPAGKTETREQFKIRLARTARNLSSSFISKSIQDMAVRCKKLFDAKGGLFEEGGKKKKKTQAKKR